MRRPSIGRGVTAIALALVALSPAPGAIAQAAIAELWVPPGNIAERDLFLGPGGPKDVPSKGGRYVVVGQDTSGNSSGYDVKDEQGRRWDLKLGIEAQPEMVASRVLWAIGYHQPVMHFLPTWKKGDDPTPQSSARFRLQSDHDSDGYWKWRDNPFADTRELRGLLVANLVLNNWDLKDDNNRIYTAPRGSQAPRRWFVVQDMGAALGKAAFPGGNRNNIEGFESQTLIESIDDGVVRFDFDGRNNEALEGITPADVAWACGLLSRITDRQWADAFRAAAYSPDLAQRYITKLKAKIAEGVALAPRRGARP
jgi:hypothetical protein